MKKTDTHRVHSHSKLFTWKRERKRENCLAGRLKSSATLSYTLRLSQLHHQRNLCPPPKCHPGHQDHPGICDCFRLPFLKWCATGDHRTQRSFPTRECRHVPCFVNLQMHALSLVSRSFWNVMKTWRRTRLIRDSATVRQSLQRVYIHVSFSSGFVISAVFYNW